MEDQRCWKGNRDNVCLCKRRGETNRYFIFKWINSATLEGHTGAVETIACMRAHSIEGETDMIITGSADGTIRIWERREIDADTGNI